MASAAAPRRLPVEMIPSEAKGPDKRFEVLPNWDLLPAPPFVWNIVGMIGAGKSSFIYTALAVWYAKYFDQIILYNGTKDSNHAWERIACHKRGEKASVLNSWDPGEFRRWFSELEDTQERRREKGRAPLRVCVVFDDMIADSILMSHGSTVLEKFVLNIRHAGGCALISTQSYMKMSKTVRINTTGLVVFRVQRREIEAIADENSQHLDPEQFVDMYRQVVIGSAEAPVEPNSFIYVDVRTRDISKKFRVGMDRFLVYAAPPGRGGGAGAAPAVAEGAVVAPPPAGAPPASKEPRKKRPRGAAPAS